MDRVFLLKEIIDNSTEQNFPSYMLLIYSIANEPSGRLRVKNVCNNERNNSGYKINMIGKGDSK